MRIVESSKTKSRLVFFTAIVIGSVGAMGQAYMLYHELVDCYPYKIMSSPSADFYKNIADIAIFIAPFVAIAAGLFAGLKRLWLMPIVPAVLCPVLFSAVFKTVSILREWNGVVDVGRNFDGTLANTVAQSFFNYSIWLSIEGLAVGAICGFLLSHFFVAKKFV